MNPEEIGSRLQKFQDYQHDHTAKTAAELDRLLIELNDMSSEVQSLPAGDKQSTSAKIDELRRQYTAWYNAAVANDEAEPDIAAVKTLEELDLEYQRYRQDFSTADEADKQVLLAEIVDCLRQAEGRTDGELVAAPIRDFLANVANTDERGSDPL